MPPKRATAAKASAATATAKAVAGKRKAADDDLPVAKWSKKIPTKNTPAKLSRISSRVKAALKPQPKLALKPAPKKAAPKKAAPKSPTKTTAAKNAAAQPAATTSNKRKAEVDDAPAAPAKRARNAKAGTITATNETPAPRKTAALKQSAAEKKAEAAKKTAAQNKVEAGKQTAAAKRTAVAIKTAAAKKAPAAQRARATKKTPAAKKAPTEKKTAAAKRAPAESTARVTKSAPPTKKAAPKPVRKLPVINQAPTERLDVFVMGEGDSGETGLGTARNAIGVKRPRLNPLLSAQTVGVVQIATGGMHALAITHDNKLLSWGVNDQGALGRDTTWNGGMRDIAANPDEEADDSDEEDDNGLNPKEATPTAIPSDAFPEGTKFVQVAAGDSTSYALTDDGSVWAWGTFRNGQGVLGFSKPEEIQATPRLLPELKKIKQIASGANHALALGIDGNIWIWGSGQQHQLGRRIVERTSIGATRPARIGTFKKNVKYIAAGTDHSFVVDNKDNVWSWGLNNYGQTGISEGAGEDNASIMIPTIVTSLNDYNMTCLKGGNHHSAGVSSESDLLVWGRHDAGACGILDSDLLEADVTRQDDKIRIVKKPNAVKGIKAKFVGAESSHTIAITTSGQAYSTGLSATYQTGLGTDEEIKEFTLIDNSAVRGKNLNWAGCGGQYSALSAVAQVPAPTVNGESEKVGASQAPAAKPSPKKTPAEGEVVGKVVTSGPPDVSFSNKYREL